MTSSAIAAVINNAPRAMPRQARQKKTQAQRYHMAMAGEFFVAAQLQRLQVSATVTYGNAKKADVVAFSLVTNRSVAVEVKTSNIGIWLVGNRVPQVSNQPWVFVHFPEDINQGPEYYVLTQAQMHAILAPLEQEYWERYLQKRGVPYGDKPGVASIKLGQVLQFRDNWATITAQL